MKALEKVLVMFALVSLVMNIAGISGGAMLCVLGILLLMLFYLLLGTFVLNGILFSGIFRKSSYQAVHTGNIVAGCVAGIVICFSLPGILFPLMHWEGAAVMWCIGLLQIAMLTVIALITYLVKKTAFRRQLLVRSCIIFIVLIVAMLARTMP